MLAHEIKNPLSGIRGAAQLLESALMTRTGATRLICEETDASFGSSTGWSLLRPAPA